MKKLIIFFIAIISSFSLILHSCNKSDLPPKNTDKKVATTEIIPSAPSAGPIITIKFKPYRATTHRPKDGKNCGCSFCFGACDFTIELEFPTMLINPDTSANTAEIYILSDLPNAESTFGIDGLLSVPSSYLSGTGLNSLTLLTGEYVYYPETEVFTINSVTYTSYGHVTVNITDN